MFLDIITRYVSNAYMIPTYQKEITWGLNNFLLFVRICRVVFAIYKSNMNGTAWIANIRCVCVFVCVSLYSISHRMLDVYYYTRRFVCMFVCWCVWESERARALVMCTTVSLFTLCSSVLSSTRYQYKLFAHYFAMPRKETTANKETYDCMGCVWVTNTHARRHRHTLIWEIESNNNWRNWTEKLCVFEEVISILYVYIISLTRRCFISLGLVE